MNGAKYMLEKSPKKNLSDLEVSEQGKSRLCSSVWIKANNVNSLELQKINVKPEDVE